MKKMSYMYKMKYYSVIRKKKITTFAEKWMELEIIMLRRYARLRKSKITCFHLFVEYRLEKNNNSKNNNNMI
jgi:hypothetical protein